MGEGRRELSILAGGRLESRPDCKRNRSLSFVVSRYFPVLAGQALAKPRIPYERQNRVSLRFAAQRSGPISSHITVIFFELDPIVWYKRLPTRLSTDAVSEYAKYREVRVSIRRYNTVLYQQRISYLCLNHERLSQCFLQNSPAIVHGVQKPKEFTTQLPVLSCNSAAQQPEGVRVTCVELLETV